ncbi:MAG: protein kinase domain-containing protein [Planctomycetota bacterium]
MSDEALLDELAESFLERFRRGEQPRITEYVEKHPAHADEIRKLFTTLLLIEDLNPPRDTSPEPPRQIGDYRILREVGRGGMGVVYEAEQISLDRHVALKILPHHTRSDPTTLERFRREAQAAARLHHTGIVPVYAVGEEDGIRYYAMQFLRGRPLDEVTVDLKKLRAAGSRPSLPGQSETYFRSVARIGVQVAEALAYAHKEGVLHRDIKPSNLLLDAMGSVWIADFGLAHAEGTDDLTQTGDIVGTLRYMAPERFRGIADARSDVYGLGLTLHELLTLEPAFATTDRQKLIAAVMDGEPPSPRRRDTTIPRDLETIVVRATAKDPAHRYAGAADMAEDLRRFLRGEPIRARRSSAVQRAVKWARRRPAAAALVCVSTAAVAIVLAVVLIHNAQLGRALDETRAQERRSRALALAGLSTQAVSHDPMLALLLAREAGHTQLLPQVTTQLHEALLASLERHVLEGHEGHVTYAAFSRDLLLTLSAGSDVPVWPRDGTVRLWNRDGSLVAVLRQETPIRSAAWSADGSRIVTAGSDGLAVIWDRRGSRVADLRGHEERLTSCCFAPPGDRVLITAADGSARLWKKDGTELAQLRGHDDGVTTGVFSPDGERVLTASRDGTARIWNSKGEQIALLAHDAAVVGAAYAPDGSHVLTASEDKAVRIWTAAGESAGTLTHPAPLRRARFSPDGQRILTTCWDETARLWSRDGTLVASLPHDDRVHDVAFSPDGRRMVTAALDHTARVWNLEGELLHVLRGHADTVRFACFSTDGLGVATTASDGTVRLWDLQSKELAVFAGHRGAVTCAHIHEDRIVSGSADGSAILWDFEANRLATLEGHTGAIQSVEFSPDGTRIVTACLDRTARVWNRDGKPLLAIPHADPVWSATFNPEGDRILTASGELLEDRAPAASVWDLRGKLQRFLKHEAWVNEATYSPDGGRIVTTSLENVHLWNARGDRVKSWQGHSQWITWAEFAPAGDLLLTASFDKVARLWTLDGEEQLALRGHALPLTTACFSADAQRILTASRDRTVRLWDRAGNELAILRGHAGPVLAARFDASGERILSASADGTMRLWLADGRDLLSLADRRITREFTAAERARFGDLLGR